MLAFATLTLASLAALANAQLTINTVPMTQCQPSLLTFSGGTPPYYISILPGRSLINPYEQLAVTSETSASWLVDIGTGTEITLGIKDSTGAINYSGVSVIAASSNDTCIGMNAVYQASIIAERSSTAAGVSSTAVSGSASTSAASASSTGSASKSASASASASASQNTSGATSTYAHVAGGLKTTLGALLGGAAVVAFFF